MLDEISVRAERAIRENVFPGCVIGVVRKDGRRAVLPCGHLTYDADAPSVAENTTYDLASVTKSIPTASLALMRIEEGKLDLSDPVKKYIPELQNDHGATIEDLLTYRVRGPRMAALRDQTSDEILSYVFAHGFDGPSGDPQYTNLPAFLLGLVVERVSGAPLDSLAQKYIFGPLDMSRTTFFPDVGIYEIPTSGIAPTEVVDGTEVRGIVHDESARVFARARRAVGHAGLFSTAPDILNFLEALLRGKYPHVVDGAHRGLGWQTSAPWFMGASSGPRTFGKTGFTGTSVVCDVERGVASVILSNRTYPKRPADAASIHSAVNAFRADIADLLIH